MGRDRDVETEAASLAAAAAGPSLKQQAGTDPRRVVV